MCLIQHMKRCDQFLAEESGAAPAIGQSCQRIDNGIVPTSATIAAFDAPQRDNNVPVARYNAIETALQLGFVFTLLTTALGNTLRRYGAMHI